MSVDIVLDGEPGRPKRGTALRFSAYVHCGQMAGWIEMPLGTEVGLGVTGDCVRWGPSSPTKKRGHSPQFPAHVFCGQTAGWIKMPLRRELRQYRVRWGRSSPLKKGGAQEPHPTFWPMYCGQTTGWIRTPLGTEVGLRRGDNALDRDPASRPSGKGHNSRHLFHPCLLWLNGRPSQLLLSTCLIIMSQSSLHGYS